jgi:hypothetical protein
MRNFAQILFSLKMKEVTYEGMTFEPYITAETIKNRIAEIGRDIVRDCGNTKPPQRSFSVRQRPLPRGRGHRRRNHLRTP